MDLSVYKTLSQEKGLTRCKTQNKANHSRDGDLSGVFSSLCARTNPKRTASAGNGVKQTPEPLMHRRAGAGARSLAAGAGAEPLAALRRGRSRLSASPFPVHCLLLSRSSGEVRPKESGVAGGEGAALDPLLTPERRDRPQPVTIAPASASPFARAALAPPPGDGQLPQPITALLGGRAAWNQPEAKRRHAGPASSSRCRSQPAGGRAGAGPAPWPMGTHVGRQGAV